MSTLHLRHAPPPLVPVFFAMNRSSNLSCNMPVPTLRLCAGHNNRLTRPCLHPCVPPPLLQWARPEDGGWDLNRLTDFYFLSTARINGTTKMWRLRFKDINNVTKGGTAKVIVNGFPSGTSGVANTTGPVMMDNLVVHKGFTYMQVCGTGVSPES